MDDFEAPVMVAAPYAVIFDMDGVLADTAEAHYRSWRMVCGQIGAGMSRKFFLETFGQPNRLIIPRLLGRQISDEESDRIADMKEECYRRIVREEIRPVPGVVELIEELNRQGVPVAVGSSGPPENVALMLDALDIEERISAVVSGKDVDRGKPAPDVFLQAAEQLGLPPMQCVVVEDAPAGIMAARAAGMKCVALTTTHRPGSLPEADLVAPDLQGISAGDLAKLVKQGGPASEA